jgi:hypothetical protein
MVKLFLFDVGLLNPMLGCSYKEIKQQGYGFLSMKKAATLLKTLSNKSSPPWGSTRVTLGMMHEQKSSSLSQMMKVPFSRLK